MQVWQASNKGQKGSWWIKKNRNNIEKYTRQPTLQHKQPSKEGELKCYECGQKGHIQPQCPKLRNQCIAVVREDDSEEIVKVIKENLERDKKWCTWRRKPSKRGRESEWKFRWRCKGFTPLLNFSQFTNRTWTRSINLWCSEWQVWGL